MKFVNSGDYWDGEEMPKSIEKIVEAIRKL